MVLVPERLQNIAAKAGDLLLSFPSYRTWPSSGDRVASDVVAVPQKWWQVMQFLCALHGYSSTLEAVMYTAAVTG